LEGHQEEGNGSEDPAFHHNAFEHIQVHLERYSDFPAHLHSHLHALQDLLYL
jgi:hypothetical protein